MTHSESTNHFKSANLTLLGTLFVTPGRPPTVQEMLCTRGICVGRARYYFKQRSRPEMLPSSFEVENKVVNFSC